MRTEMPRVPPAEAKSFHLEQLGEDAVEHLLNLDLANKPEAQVPLLQFLRAMGVPDTTLQKSKVFDTVRSSKAYEASVKEGRSFDDLVKLASGG